MISSPIMGEKEEQRLCKLYVHIGYSTHSAPSLSKVAVCLVDSSHSFLSQRINAGRHSPAQCTTAVYTQLAHAEIIDQEINNIWLVVDYFNLIGSPAFQV